MNLRAIVVDDEPVAREGLVALVSAADDITVIGAFGSGASAAQGIVELAPDLVLLDVQMPDMSGLEVMRRVGAERMPYVIFVTAFDQFAVDAFELNALDYVLKPFADTRMHAALERARRAIRSRALDALTGKYQQLLDEMGERRTSQPAVERLAIHSVGSTQYVTVSDIEWIEADSNYARLYVHGRALLIRESLQSLAERLDQRFLRVHRSAIVRTDRVQELRRGRDGEFAVIMRSGARVAVSRSRVPALESRLA